MNDSTSLDAAAIRDVFEAQKRWQWTLRLEPAARRIDRLLGLKAAILEFESEVREALHADLGKPRAGVGELIVLHDIDEALEHLAGWMADERFGPLDRLGVAHARIRREPRGVVLIFGAWNFPFQLVFQPLVAALAAGNCAVVKPNELAPATSRVTARIIERAFDRQTVAAFEGGVELANALLELPFDHIFFTGSPAVGRLVMGAAARHLSTVTLELGGKNPVLVAPRVDLPRAARRIMGARVRNSGQVCLCPEYVFVPAGRCEEFVRLLGQSIETDILRDGEVDPDSYGHIVDERNFRRVRRYLDDALGRGARLAWGGRVDETRRIVHPTVLLDVPEDAAIMQEEVFAPILVVKPYAHEDEAFAYVQRRGKPLALYVFSDDDAFTERAIANTSSGGVTVNDCYVHCWDTRLPFGGVNGSGMGRYHGVHGFRELSHERAVANVARA